MKDVSEQDGRTVLFVSHNLDAVTALCSKGILLCDGKIFEKGNIQSVIEKYTTNHSTSLFSPEETPGIFNIKQHASKKRTGFGIQLVKTYCDDQLSDTMYTGCNFKFEVFIENYSVSRNIVLGFVIRDHFDRPLVAINNKHLNIELNNGGSSDFMLTFEIAQFLLYGQERFTIDLYFGDGVTDFEVIPNAFHINMSASNLYQASILPDKNMNKVIMPSIFAAITPSKALTK